MSFDLLAPAWLLLLAPLALVWWRRRTGHRAHDLLRLVCPVLIVMALSQPRLVLERRGGVLVVAADRSASLPADAAERQAEIIRLLEQERGSRDRIAVLGFAENIAVEQLPDAGRFGGFTGFQAGVATRLAAALEAARALVPRDRHGRILVLSDGRFTDSDPLDLGLERGAGLPVDYRLITRPAGSDLAVINLDLPATVEPGEAFQFSAELLVPEPAEVAYRLLRDGRELATGTINFAAGRRHLLFQDRLAAAGNARYRLEISSSLADPCPENNRADAVVAVVGGKPLLHVGHAESRLPRLAAAGGLEVVSLAPEAMNWSLDGLSRFRGVILENVPATKLGYGGQEALARVIEDLGGGLMITGGRQSFGVGGYYHSPLGELLPVSMELRREHRKLSTAVVVVLDRSGSMQMPVAGGHAKMDLANQGTAAVLDLLTDNDELGVVAVDSQAHVVVGLAQVGEQRGEMGRRIRAIKSMGGGIFVYEGLSHAARMIVRATAGTRHIILFADAADSEEPGEYQQLLSDLREIGVTVSVIGLGSEKDCDAELLKDIAARGDGNVYFSSAAEELPQLFAQETLTVFRSAFVEVPVAPVWAEDLPVIAEIPGGEAPPLGGYNLCYLRPGASLGARSGDEHQAPLLAFWQRGAGRVIAFTGEVDGKFTGEFGAWPGCGPLYLSCLRWLLRREGEGDDWFVSVQRDGNDVLVVLELDPARGREPFRGRPRLLHLRDGAAGIAREEQFFQWAGRDRLHSRVTLTGDGTSHLHLLAETAAGDSVIQHCASPCLPYAVEFTPETEFERGSRTLSRLAAITGGVERVSLDGIFRDIPPFRRPIPLWHLLALIALVALLLEVVWRRLGISGWRQRYRVPVAVPSLSRSVARPEASAATATDAPPAVSGNVLGAMRKARHRAQERLRDDP